MSMAAYLKYETRENVIRKSPMKAAVLRTIGQPLSIEEVRIGLPGPHEVRRADHRLRRLSALRR